jgi:glycosyltransferase involved in cell wall biosynthesis
MTTPVLSIVVPTREGFSSHWLAELLKIGGEVEFILSHPPGMKKPEIADPRVQQINSAFRGEIIQRMTGLLNARGTYILTVNCDEYLNPNITEIAVAYFQRFPESWMMRLSKKAFEYGDQASLERPWHSVDIAQMKVCSRVEGTYKLYGEPDYILEIPIAPVDNKFDIGCFVRGRKDHHGEHTENFDKKVWKNEMVQAALKELVSTMTFAGSIKYVPFWCLDRLLGLFIQSKFYEKGKVIGHLLPDPEQIRVEDNPPNHKRTRRFYVFAEILLLRRFPQYGYLWNLIVHQVVEIPLRAIDLAKRKVTNFKKDPVSSETMPG